MKGRRDRGSVPWQRRATAMLTSLSLVLSGITLPPPALAAEVDDGAAALERVLAQSEPQVVSSASTNNLELALQSEIEETTDEHPEGKSGKIVILASGTGSNITLQEDRIYAVLGGTVTIAGNTTNPYARVLANTKATIYVAPGATLNINGSAGSGRNRGCPGIYLPSGSTVEFVGGGSVNVTGGKGGGGGGGGWGAGDNTKSGGGGGAGGGGGGAGIGTHGGYGGWGGSGGGDNGGGWGGNPGGGSEGTGGTVNASPTLSAFNTSNGANGGGAGGGGSYGCGGGGGGGGGGQGGDAIGAGGAGGGGGGGGEGCHHGLAGKKWKGEGGIGGYGWGNGGRGSAGSHKDDNDKGHGGGGGAGWQPASTARNAGIYRIVSTRADYTVEFDVNHDTSTYADLTPSSDTENWDREVTIGETAIRGLEKLPTRTGFKFKGFYDAPRNGNQLFDEKGNPNTAGLTQGSATAGFFVDNSGKWAVGNIGQYTDSAGATQYFFQNKLYAQWESDSSKVYFDATGGASSMIKDEVYLGDPIANLPQPPTKPGYNFDGFYRSKDDDAVQVYDENMRYTVQDTSGVAAASFLDFCDGDKAYSWNGNGSWDVTDGSLTYYAHWEPVTYYIQYMSWDDELKDDAVVPLYDENGDLMSYTIEAGGKTQTLYSVEQHVFGTFRLASDTDLGLERDHYIFKGWNIYSSQDWKMYEINRDYRGGLGTTQDQVVTLYAAWEPTGQVDMIYDGQGGTGIPSRDMAYTEPDYVYHIAEKEPTKAGCTFLGWNTSSDGKGDWYRYGHDGEVIDASAPGWSQYLSGGETAIFHDKIEAPSQSVVFYAIWSTNPTLTYNPNGGVGHIDTKNYAPQSMVDLEFDPDKLPTLEGHTFAGWSTAREPGEGDTIFRTSADKLNMPDANVILYAQWEKDLETITAHLGSLNAEYVLNQQGVTFWRWQDEAATTEITNVAESTLKVPYGESFDFAILVPPQYDGSDMTASSNGSVLVRKGTVPAEGGGVYYLYNVGTPRSAQAIEASNIKVNEYKVNLVANGGVFGHTEEPYTYEDEHGQTQQGINYISRNVTSYVYGEEIALPDEETQGISRTGYKFEGWYADPNFTGFPVTHITPGMTGKQTFYAKWTEVHFTVRYNTSPAHLFEDDSTQKTYTENVPFGSSQKLVGIAELCGANHTGIFKGWATASGSSVVSYIDGQFTSNFVPLIDDADGKYYADLYAIWEPDYRTVTFDAAGGIFTTIKEDNTEEISSAIYEIVDKGNGVSAPTSVPSRDGYVFDGWKLDEVEVSEWPYTVMDNTTFTAAWIANTETITYAPNGATDANGADDNSQEFTVGTANALADPSDIGFEAPTYVVSTTYEANDGFPTDLTDDGYLFETITADDSDHYDAVDSSHNTNAKATQLGEPIYEYTTTDPVGTTSRTWAKNPLFPQDSDLAQYVVKNIDSGEYAFVSGDTVPGATGSTTNRVARLKTENVLYKYTKNVTTAPLVFNGWATTVTETPVEDAINVMQPGPVIFNSGQVMTSIPDTDTLYAVWAKDKTPYVSFDANEGTWGAAGQPAAAELVDNSGTLVVSETPSDVSRIGYTLAGWATSADATADDVITVGTTGLSDGDTLYAIWTPVTYTIVYHGDTLYDDEGNQTAAGVNLTQTFVYDEQQSLEPFSRESAFWSTFTYYDYIKDLKGWTTNPEITTDDNGADTRSLDYVDGQVILNLFSTSGNTLDLYPVWDLNFFTTTFNTKGGTAVDPFTLTGGTTTLPGTRGNTSAPTRNGFKFLGWDTADHDDQAEDAEQVDLPTYPATADCPEFLIEEDTFLYAWWQVVTTDHVTYKYGYELVGDTKGEFDLDDTEYLNGDTFVIAFDSNITRRSGYTFAGWKLEGDTTDTLYTGLDAEGNITEQTLTFEKGMTFVAQWEPISYHIQYILNDGEAAVGSDIATQTVRYNEPAPLKTFGMPDEDGTFDYVFTSMPTGKHFIGWTTQRDSSVADYTNGYIVAKQPVDGDPETTPNFSITQDDTVLLYAVWVPNHGTLRLMDGYSDPEAVVEEVTQISDGQGYPSLTTVPTRLGYDFQGYYTEVGGNGTKLYDGSLAGLSADAMRVDSDGAVTTLYAHWTRAHYAVVYRDKRGNELKKDETPEVGTNYKTSAMVEGITLQDGEKLKWVVGSYENYKVDGYSFDAGAEINFDEWPTPPGAPTSGTTVSLFAYAVGTTTHNVRYDANGGSWPKGRIPSSVQVQEGDFFNVSFDTVPTKTGYEFVGWAKPGNDSNYIMYDEAHYNALDEETQSLPTTATPITTDGGYSVGCTIVEDTTLYAVFDPLLYTITYDGNGGKTSSGAATMTEEGKRSYDDRAKLEKDTLFTKEDSEFLGWGTNSKVLRYVAEEEVKALTDESTITLYAIWTAKEKDDQGGDTPPSSTKAFTVGSIANQTYTGAEIQAKPSVKDGSKTLTLNQDYTLVWSNNVKVGTATVTVTGIGSYNDYTGKATFKIVAAQASKLTVAAVADQTYTGKAITPKPTVKLGSVTLKEGTDYTLSYKNNVNIGTATITVTGKGGVTGTKAVTFKITTIPASKLTVAAIPDQAYTGKAITPKPKVTSGGATLKEGTDYALSYKGNVNIGTATVTVTGKGSYAGARAVTFRITATGSTAAGGTSAPRVSASKLAVAAVAAQTYTARPITPKPKVTYGGATLREGTDYALSYRDNVNEGTATITVTGKGSYTGTRSVPFTIRLVTFPDVNAKTHWARRAVSLMASMKVISGYADGNFGPDDNLKRGHIAIMLWGLAGKPQPGAGAKTFPDVKAGSSWYKAVAWASSLGIVNGYADGTFRPGDKVSRQELASMLANFGKRYLRTGRSGSAADYKAMSDASKVSSWAQGTVGWCFANGIMPERPGAKQIRPKDKATRAETVSMLFNLYLGLMAT